MAKRERVQPHSLEAEAAVVGGVMIDPRQLGAARARVTRPDFFREAHGVIFEVMCDLADRESGLDLPLVVIELQRRNLLEQAGGAGYVSTLIDGVPRSTNVEHYAAVVAEKARLRAVIKAASTLAERAYENEPSELLINEAVPAIARLAPRRGVMVDADDAVLNYYNAAVSGELVQPVPLGYEDLDHQLDGGVREGDLAIIAARPSVGKTALAVGIADHVARSGRRAAIFSLEMGQGKIAARLLSLRSRVSHIKVETGQLTHEESDRVIEAVQAERVPLHLEFEARTVAELVAWVQKLNAQHEDRLACAVVDYIQLLAPDRRRASDEAEMASISHALKSLAKQEKLALIALSQLSRAPEGRKDKRPQLSDLRGSGALEQDCDVCMLLYRPDRPDEGEEGVAEVIVAKNRDGGKGVVRMAFVEHLAMFADLATPHRD